VAGEPGLLSGRGHCVVFCVWYLKKFECV
jgi:hypothetical protein